METFFEITTEIQNHRSKPEEEQCFLVRDIQNEQGSCGFYDLALQWTKEFEQLNKGREWDGEFWEEIEKFAADKLK